MDASRLVYENMKLKDQLRELNAKLRAEQGKSLQKQLDELQVELDRAKARNAITEEELRAAQAKNDKSKIDLQVQHDKITTLKKAASKAASQLDMGLRELRGEPQESKELLLEANGVTNTLQLYTETFISEVFSKMQNKINSKYLTAIITTLENGQNIHEHKTNMSSDHAVKYLKVLVDKTVDQLSQATKANQS